MANVWLHKIFPCLQMFHMLSLCQTLQEHFKKMICLVLGSNSMEVEMWPQCFEVVPGGEEGSVCPGAKEPSGPSWAICVSISLPFLLETLPDERQDIKVPCAHPGWLRGSSSLQAAAPTETHSVRVDVKFFGDLSPITQLSNQNLCIFTAMCVITFSELHR